MAIEQLFREEIKEITEEGRYGLVVDPLPSVEPAASIVGWPNTSLLTVDDISARFPALGLVTVPVTQPSWRYRHFRCTAAISEVYPWSLQSGILVTCDEYCEAFFGSNGEMNPQSSVIRLEDVGKPVVIGGKLCAPRRPQGHDRRDGRLEVVFYGANQVKWLESGVFIGMEVTVGGYSPGGVIDAGLQLINQRIQEQGITVVKIPEVV